MILIGKVKTGLGNASYWMKKAEKAFEQKLGTQLYNGTLNVELKDKYILDGNLKILNRGEYGGDQDVYIKECIVLGHKSYIVRTEKNSKKDGDHPLNLLEIISDVCFRERYNLKDGDIIEININ
ncbi:MAG: DUF120 domain-containing protein [Clostridia bacterium]|nr:DUF120 domain-containing protein [Clostridia bacterium]